MSTIPAQQPKALQLADRLKERIRQLNNSWNAAWNRSTEEFDLCAKSEDELRCQHAEITHLTAENKAQLAKIQKHLAEEDASRPDMADAYCGAREDLAIWKRRALEAEEKLRAESTVSARLVSELNSSNGPTHMGEPAQQRQPLSYRQIAEATTKFGDVWSDKVIGISRAIEAAHGIGEKT